MSLEEYISERCPDLDYYGVDMEFGLYTADPDDLQFLVDLEANLMPELEKRQELLEELYSREWYTARHIGKCLSWDIKVWKSIEAEIPDQLKDEYGLNSRFDGRWEEECKDGKMFWLICESALDFVGPTYRRGVSSYLIDRWYTGDEEVDKCDYVLWQAGKSGGHLILEEFDGKSTVGDSIRSAPSEWLSKLLRFCESLDKFDPDDAFIYEAAHYRQQLEEDWRLEEASPLLEVSNDSYRL